MKKVAALISLGIAIVVFGLLLVKPLCVSAGGTLKFEQKVDLNGDGRLDHIVLDFSGPDSENSYVLSVNGVKVDGMAVSVCRKLNIVDVYKKDKFKEIAIEEEGPSSDYKTTFYWYDGKKLVKMGKVQGKSVTEKLIKGDGIVGAISRFMLLQTWFYHDQYRLGAKHTLNHINKKWYRAAYSQQPVKVLKPLKLYKDIGSKSLVVALKPGDKLQLLGSDNKAWCVAKTQSGKLGWFEMKDFLKVKQFGVVATLVFEGLCMAD